MKAGAFAQLTRQRSLLRKREGRLRSDYRQIETIQKTAFEELDSQRQVGGPRFLQRGYRP